MPPDVLSGSVVLAGAGRAGAAFARSWREAGGSLARIIVRDAAKRLPADLEGTPRASAESPGPACDVLVLAVPDDAIARIAAELAPRLACGCAIHLSGALASD
ncbi:MAG TPA: NAD(P)-binding domain-containing protein, partial [Thermoanaerobaculia bacterium]|nr:NAD(P)-binding domain-containing protein [Thermoanaerobaculia bacterium]